MAYVQEAMGFLPEGYVHRLNLELGMGVTSTWLNTPQGPGYGPVPHSRM